MLNNVYRARSLKRLGTTVVRPCVVCYPSTFLERSDPESETGDIAVVLSYFYLSLLLPMPICLFLCLDVWWTSVKREYGDAMDRLAPLS